MMRKSIIFILLTASVFLFSCSEENTPKPDYISEGKYEGNYFPTNEWRECDPEEVGMNSKKLKAVYEYCDSDSRNTFSYLVIKDGYIVSEKYFGNYNSDSNIKSYSLAKSFTAALTGIAIQDGLINSVDDKIADYFPILHDSEVQVEKKEVTIKQLLTMTSGFEWSEDEISFTDNDLNNIRSSSNYVDYVLNKPIVETPGTVWNYSSGMPILLGGLLENATGIINYEYAKQTLFSDLGITNTEWKSDRDGHTIAAWGLQMNTRNYAKLGFLYWKNGLWEGNQILPDYWVTDTRKPALENTLQYGYLWWRAYRYEDHIDSQVPEDTYMAVGLFQKYIIVIPSYDLVLIRLGEDWTEGENGWDTAEFISLVIDAVGNQ
jgi:hypothetical protein